MSALNFDPEQPPLTAEEVRQRARDWYARQVEVLSMVHGKDWPKHREWLESYLKEEIRLRLVAMGWKVRK